jgi:hypothetical protein
LPILAGTQNLGNESGGLPYDNTTMSIKNIVIGDEISVSGYSCQTIVHIATIGLAEAFILSGIIREAIIAHNIAHSS